MMSRYLLLQIKNWTLTLSSNIHLCPFIRINTLTISDRRIRIVLVRSQEEESKRHIVPTKIDLRFDHIHIFYEESLRPVRNSPVSLPSLKGHWGSTHSNSGCFSMNSLTARLDYSKSNLQRFVSTDNLLHNPITGNNVATRTDQRRISLALQYVIFE